MSLVVTPEIAEQLNFPIHPLDETFKEMGFKKKHGTSRIAYIGEDLTFKVPISDPIKAWKVYQQRKKIDKNEGTHYAKSFLKDPEDEIHSLKYMVLRGYLQNIREARLSPILGNLAVPTHMTADGFLRPQATAPEHPQDKKIRAIFEKIRPFLRDLAVDTRVTLGAFLEEAALENLSPLLGDLSVTEAIPLNGFLNVQETAQPLNRLMGNDIKTILKNRLGNASDADIHSFHSASNYGWHQAQVKFLDYGGDQIGGIIETHKEGVRLALHDMMEQDANSSV
jgi:hypothetical protein